MNRSTEGVSSLMRVGTVFVFSCLAFVASSAERGVPPVRVHSSAEFQPVAEFQNMAVRRLDDGRVVVANTSAMVIWDGARWRSYPHPRGLGTLWSVVPDSDGRFYVGFSGDIGWFEPDGAGGYSYMSALDWLPAEQREFGTIWSAIRGRDGIWFSAGEQTMLLQPEQRRVRVWPTRKFGVFLFPIGDEVWFNDRGVGLLRVVGSGDALDLEPIPGGEVFNGMPILGVARLSNGDVIVGSAEGELYRYRDAQVTPYATALWPALVENGLQTLLGLSDGTLAIGFLNSGPWVVDAGGRVLERYGDAEGVPPLTTFLLHEDIVGTLWVAQNQNVVEIARGSGHSRFDRLRGIPDANSLHRHEGRLYAGSLSGWYRLQSGEGGSRFERIKQGPRNTWSMATAGNWLYVAGRGLERYRIDAKGAIAAQESVVRMQFGKSVLPSRQHVDRLYFAGTDGAAIIDAASSAEPRVHTVALEGSPVFIAEDGPDAFWVSDQNARFWRVHESGEGWQSEVFDAASGVLDGETMPVPGSDGPWFLAVAGPMDWDTDARRFRPSERWPSGAPRPRMEALFDAGDRLWLRADGRSGMVLKSAPQSFVQTAFQGSDDRSQVTAFLPEGDVLWVARSDGVQRIELTRAVAPAAAEPSIQRVWDSLAARPLSIGGQHAVPIERRDLRIEFAMPAALRGAATLYRSRMLGNDRDWSEFGSGSERTYTNLPDGRLEFVVQARDAFGIVSESRPLVLDAAAPWFRKRTAYAVYFAASLLALWAAMHFGSKRRQRQMSARQLELEGVVAARTAELIASNVQLAQQAERLVEVDRMKTRFFVNVGHEFRTPLTLVLGPIEDLLRDARERISERVRSQLQLAQRNARRVLDLIVELLDVNRLEQGQLSLTLATHDLVPMLERVAAENAPLAERFGQTLSVDLGGVESAACAFDPLQIERALSNLIGNAAKYSPRGTAIALALARDNATWTISVRDRGRGIAPDALPHVFDRFFQTDGSDRASGLGIGLSLVREIALAHGGDVTVTSTLGVGSTFVLRLPVSAPDAQTGALASGPHAAFDEVADAAQESKRHSRAAQGRAPVGAGFDSAGDLPVPGNLSREPDSGRGRERVLIVDDHDDLRLRVRDLLGHRFEVIEAADGNAAWQLARDELPDLIVSDVMMPGCDGVELTRRLRSHADTEAIGILLLTAKVGSDHAVLGLQAGANDYLAKPFDASELLARCEAIVAHARRLQHRLGAAVPAAPNEPIDSQDTRWRQRLDQHIAANLHDPEFGIEELARALHGDRTQLFRRCKEILGQSPSDYLRDTRLAHSHRLLEQAAGNVSEVAYASGFDSLSSFTRAFKTRYGVPPSQARARTAG